jgi:hypothetical protein
MGFTGYWNMLLQFLKLGNLCNMGFRGFNKEAVMDCEYVLVVKKETGQSIVGPFHASLPQEAEEKASKVILEEQRKSDRETAGGMQRLVTGRLFRCMREFDGSKLVKLERSPDSIHW